MYNLIIFFPLLSFFLGSLGGFYFGREGVAFFTCFFGFVCFFFSLFAFYEIILCQSVVSVFFWDWLFLGNYCIAFGLFFDSLTCVMLVIITGISACVNFYVVGYMSHDPHITRFLSYLSLFTFFMLFLVSSDNFLQMFIGWEGVGVCSYLLINFWYRRLLANKAALKAMIVNRIADVLFILGIILILLIFKTTNFIIVFDLVHFFVSDNLYFFGFCCNKITFICFFLLIGGIGKSAQIGLHTWLPDAMEGPTPVSALLHAATMVTAGVFLIIRCSPLFEYSPNILFLASFFGGLTAFFFSISGTFQYDIKKVIAYSTCGQLGFMFFSCGLSQYQIAIFHLFNHAFFKALLFLSAGSVIHALFDEQDMRKMGSLYGLLSFTYFSIFLGSLCILGFPFLAGFYSKDLLLELAYSCYIIDGNFIYFLGISGAFFTVVYSTRLLIFVFFFNTNFYRNFSLIREDNFFMSFSIFFLSIASIFVGYLCSDSFLGWGTFFWSSSLFLLPENFIFVDATLISPFVKNLPLLTCVLGFIFCLSLSFFFSFRLNFFRKNLIFLFNQVAPFFYFSGFFNSIFNFLLLYIYKFSYELNTKKFDKGFLEFLGPYGLYRFFYVFSNFLKEAPPAIIFFNICMFFLFICFIILFFLLHLSIFVFFSKHFGLLVLVFLALLFDTFFVQNFIGFNLLNNKLFIKIKKFYVF
jgi:proton-translocating NADH-quinone oxidoreductase chain L